MRFIIPNYSIPDSFVDNVAFSLRAMGHDVLTAPPRSSILDQRTLHLLQMGYDKFYPSALTHQEKWLRKTYKTFRPDVVLALTQVIKEEILLEIKRDGIVTIAWWGDAPANMSRHGLLCNGWDFIYLKDKFAVSKLRTLDLPAYYLTEAMNPHWHRPVYSDVNSSILFVGNTYDYRHYLICKLISSGEKDIRLFGNKPPRWANPIVNSVFQNRFIIKEEKSLEFGSSAACINSTAMSEGNSVNCRAFEIAGAKGLQIMEYREAIEDCFTPGKEILTYSHFSELKENIERVRKDKHFALTIRENGYKRAISEHTYEHKLGIILSNLGYK